MAFHRSVYQSMTHAPEYIKEYRTLLQQQGDKSMDDDSNSTSSDQLATTIINPQSPSSLAAAHLRQVHSRPSSQQGRFPLSPSNSSSLPPVPPIDGATTTVDELKTELEAKGIAVHPPRRDPFAPSADNPLVPETVVKMIAEKEASVRLPLRFRDPSVYNYPKMDNHPAYRTTASVYGSQEPRAIELPSAYYSTSSSFTRDLGTSMYRNNSLVCSKHPTRPTPLSFAVAPSTPSAPPQ